MLWSFGCHPGVQNLLLHSTPLLPHGAVWEDSQAPHTLISFCPVLSCRSALCLGSGAKLKQNQPLLPSPQKGPLTHLGQLALQLTSGSCRSSLHPLFFSPHYVWHCWASLPLLVFAPSLLASLLSFCLNWRGSGKLTRLEGGACSLLGRPEVGRKRAGWRMGLRGGKEGSLPRMETWGMLSLSVALGSHVTIPDVSPSLCGLLPLSLVLQG